MIKFDYWIKGSAAPTRIADTESGNQHNEVASNFVAKIKIDPAKEISIFDGLIRYANKLKIKTYNFAYYPENQLGAAVESLIKRIISHFENKGLSEIDAENSIIGVLGIDQELYLALTETDKAGLYVQKHDNWIAVRQQEIELYELDERKARYLKNGLLKIMERENIVNESNLFFNIEDRKTKELIQDISFEDINNNNFYRARTPPMKPSGFIPYPKGYRAESIFALDFRNFLIS